MCACARYACVYVCVCVFVGVGACVNKDIHAYKYKQNLHSYIHTFVQIEVLNNKLAQALFFSHNMCIYIHTYIYTYIHTYIHTDRSFKQ